MFGFMMNLILAALLLAAPNAQAETGKDGLDTLASLFSHQNTIPPQCDGGEKQPYWCDTYIADHLQRNKDYRRDRAFSQAERKRECLKEKRRIENQSKEVKNQCRELVGTFGSNISTCKARIEECIMGGSGGSRRFSSTSSICSKISRRRLLERIEDRLPDRQDDRDEAWKDLVEAQEDTQEQANEMQMEQLQIQRRSEELQTQMQEERDNVQVRFDDLARNLQKEELVSASRAQKIRNTIRGLQTSITNLNLTKRAELSAKYAAEMDEKYEACVAVFRADAEKLQTEFNAQARAGTRRMANVGELLDWQPVSKNPRLRRNFERCKRRSLRLAQLKQQAEAVGVIAEIGNIKTQIDGLKEELKVLDEAIRQNRNIQQQAKNSILQQSITRLDGLNRQLLFIQQEAMIAQQIGVQKAQTNQVKVQRAESLFREKETLVREDEGTQSELADVEDAPDADDMTDQLADLKDDIDGLDGQYDTDYVAGFRDNCSEYDVPDIGDIRGPATQTGSGALGDGGDGGVSPSGTSPEASGTNQTGMGSPESDPTPP